MDSRLSKDITIEILSRTTLRSFDAMRCTNKEINKLTYDSNLVDLHKQRNGIVSGLITQTNPHGSSNKYFREFAPSRGSKTLDLGFLPGRAGIRASSDHGIIVLERYDPLVFYVCKPATKQLVQLPKPSKTENDTDNVAIVIMDSEPLRYKIFRFSRSWGPLFQEQSTYCWEIFDSSACELEWRVSEPIELPYGDLMHMQSITIRGFIYILLPNNKVMKYDAYLEKLTSTFGVPKETHNYLENSAGRRLVNYKGKLGFACTKLKSFWEIWVLSINKSWVKTFVLNKREITKRMSLQGLCDADTAIMWYCFGVLFYRFKRDYSEPDEEGERGYELSNGPDEACVELNDWSDKTFLLRSDFDIVDLVP